MLIAIPSCGPSADLPERPNAAVEEIEGPSAVGQSESSATSPDVRELADGTNQFALDLYGRLRTDSAGNLFFSPASLSTALAMAWAGAKGSTADQMAQVLHFPLKPEKLHPAFRVLQATWNAPTQKSQFQLIVANRLWAQSGFAILPDFLTITRQDYGAEAAQVDFAHQSDQARLEINAWVEKQTQGKIRDLIMPRVLDSLTRLVLVNAIYFKGSWAEPFHKEATELAPFHVTASQQTNVPLMTRQDRFRYRAGDGFKALELPYGNGDIAMVILLPDGVDKVRDIEARLTVANLSKWLSDLRTQRVKVSIPRFKVNSQFQLAETLKAMGMTHVFTSGEADLSGITTKEKLVLSAVIHKAMVDVNEEGTEAAAATANPFVKSEAPIPSEPAIFRADHPFVFLIRDERTGSILFLGRLVDPRVEG